jgi:hypothetical protein
MVIDYGGRTIPWYENIPIGARNYVKEEMPVAPSQNEIQKYIAEQEHYQSKLREGSGFLNDTLGNLNPIKIAAIVAATVSGNPELIPVIVGADTAIQGGSPEDILKSAAIAAATQAIGGQISGGAEGFTSASETGLPTLAGEGIASDVGATLLNDVNYPTYDFSPEVPIQNVSPEYDPTGSFASYNPTPIYDFSPEVPVEQVSPELDPTSYPTPFEPAPVYDFSPETPVEDVSPELDPTGSLADTLNPSLKDIYKTLKAANSVRKLLTPQQRAAQALTRTPLQNAQASQQQSNMANILRGTQMPQTMTPAIYNQKNPFNFGQQNQPVQDTTALANLLRTA